jgi:hypothetical protein
MIVLLILALQSDPIEKKWEGKGSKNKQAGVRLIADEAAWKELWERHTGEKEEAPKIDFKTHWIVAIFPEGEYHHIASSGKIDDKEVSIRIVLGGKEASGYAPYHCILLLPRSTQPIRISLNVNSCTGIDPEKEKIFVLNAK